MVFGPLSFVAQSRHTSTAYVYDKVARSTASIDPL